MLQSDMFPLCDNLFHIFQSRLSEVLQRWEEYQAVVQDCDRYMNEEVTPWQADIRNINLDNIDIASTQLNIAKVSHSIGKVQIQIPFIWKVKGHFCLLLHRLWYWWSLT